MQGTRSILLSLLAVGLVGCISSHSDVRTDFKTSGELLAKAETAEGVPVQWTLYSGERGAPRLNRTLSTRSTTPRIGLSASPMTSERAANAGVEPFVGVWVESVSARSPAGQAGIVKGDIIVKVAGKSVTSVEQFSHLILTEGVPGEDLELELRVYRQRGEPVDGRPTATVVVQPESHEVSESSTESFELESSRGVQQYTGLQLASVPPSLSREVYGEDREIVVVSGVLRGSPAYEAGLRAGDRLVQCDSRPVDSLDTVRQSVRHRLDENWQAYDLADADDLDGRRDHGGEVVLEVTGRLGKHTARLELTDELDDVTRFYVPIITRYRSDVDSTSLSFLDFIFQFGFNYDSHTYHSISRSPADTWSLSLFPLGMFEFRKGLDSNRYTFFWFMDFETGR
jgi:hypothetical protein